jgi:hypothetical protein
MTLTAPSIAAGVNADIGFDVTLINDDANNVITAAAGQ